MLSERLKKLRKDSGKTQQQIADMLSITQAAYSKYECSLAEPDFSSLQKLADYFNVSVDYLLGRTEETQKKEPTTEVVGSKESQVLTQDILAQLNVLTDDERKSFLQFFNETLKSRPNKK